MGHPDLRIPMRAGHSIPEVRLTRLMVSVIQSKLRLPVDDISRFTSLLLYNRSTEAPPNHPNQILFCWWYKEGRHTFTDLYCIMQMHAAGSSAPPALQKYCQCQSSLCVSVGVLD